MLEIIGKKLGMTQIFLKDGSTVPVTAVLAGPCSVVQKKNQEKDGYFAIQIGFEEKKLKQTSKPLQGHFKKTKLTPKKILREFRTDKKESDMYKEGQNITLDTVIHQNDYIDATGISKGKGFTGVIKRHGFKGGKASHGVHEYHRHGGSHGASSNPGRMVPGLKMAGQHGNKQVTVQNLKVVQINKERNIAFIKGAVPGAPGGYLVIRKTVKKKKNK